MYMACFFIRIWWGMYCVVMGRRLIALIVML